MVCVSPPTSIESVTSFDPVLTIVPMKRASSSWSLMNSAFRMSIEPVLTFTPSVICLISLVCAGDMNSQPVAPSAMDAATATDTSTRARKRFLRKITMWTRRSAPILPIVGGAGRPGPLPETPLW